MLMAARAPRTIAPPPLLCWPERLEIDRLRGAQDDLRRRLAGLRPNSHRRVVLQVRLSDLTAQIIRRELALRGTS